MIVYNKHTLSEFPYALTYDDINIVPKYSEIESRKECSLKTRISEHYELDIPIVSSPMDTVTEGDMIVSLSAYGGCGVLHRFMTIDEQVEMIKNIAYKHTPPSVVAIGITGDYLERAQALSDYVNILLLDTAHGNTKTMKETIENLRKVLPDEIDIIAGNVATYNGAWHLIDCGVNSIRINIGAGSLCSTRLRAGVGIPTVSSLLDVLKARFDYYSIIKDSGYPPRYIPVIADGGIRTSGDIAKALSLGADCVMLGSMLAGTKETPGKVYKVNGKLCKQYRGSASWGVKEENGQDLRNIEGEETFVPYKGKVERIINEICDGVRSAMSYTNSRTLEEFRNNSEYVIVTSNGLRESKPFLVGE